MFPGGRCEGESTQSCEARFSPSRSPFLGTHFGAYVVVGVMLLGGRWILRCRSRQAKPDGKAARVAGLFPVFWHNLQHPTKSNPSPRQQSNTFHNAEQRRGREGWSARRGRWPSQLRMLPLLAPAACQNAPSRKGKHLPHAKMLHPGRENTCRMPKCSIPEGKTPAACQNAPSRKGKHLPQAKCSTRKGKAACPNAPPRKGKPHAKCPTPGRDSHPPNFMLK